MTMSTTVKKVDSAHSPKGEMGQKLLAEGKSLAMRLWEDEQPGESKPAESRPYETVGYVLKGKAELQIDGDRVTLSAGDSWVVPKDAKHTYVIKEAFTAVEATSPPAREHGVS